MPTLIATAGSSTANSYCTLAEANTYAETIPNEAIWSAADDDAKIAALITATRALDDQYEWVGYKVTTTQALRWPRSGVTDRDAYAVTNTAIPTFLKNAVAEFARQLIKGDRYAARDDAKGGIESVTAGSVSVTFNSLDRINLMPESVTSMLDFYSTGSQSGGINVPLVRV